MTLQTLPASSVEPKFVPIAAAAAACLGQCAVVLGTMPGRVYSADSRVLPGGTIGKHIRHTLDHFRAALDGVETAIDYDHRERDVPEETDPRVALGIVEELVGRLRGLDHAALTRPVRIRVMLASDGTEAELPSTLSRELAFVTHHAIHHNAMIKAIAAEHGVAAPAEFGKAPSTLNFERPR